MRFVRIYTLSRKSKPYHPKTESQSPNPQHLETQTPKPQTPKPEPQSPKPISSIPLFLKPQCHTRWGKFGDCDGQAPGTKEAGNAATQPPHSPNKR